MRSLCGRRVAQPFGSRATDVQLAEIDDEIEEEQDEHNQTREAAGGGFGFHLSYIPGPVQLMLAVHSSTFDASSTFSRGMTGRSPSFCSSAFS